MANDPNTIQYVIQEDGFWYIASKEKNPYVPELTVSAKGVANGLSEEYNDGWDFGPDSYDPNSTANPPYTETSGIQEAYNYAITVYKNIKFMGGLFLIDVPLEIGSQSGLNNGQQNISIEGTGYMYGLTGPSNQTGATIIQISNNFDISTNTYMIQIGQPSTGSGTTQYEGSFGNISLNGVSPNGSNQVQVGIWINNIFNARIHDINNPVSYNPSQYLIFQEGFNSATGNAPIIENIMAYGCSLHFEPNAECFYNNIGIDSATYTYSLEIGCSNNDGDNGPTLNNLNIWGPNNGQSTVLPFIKLIGMTGSGVYGYYTSTVINNVNLHGLIANRSVIDASESTTPIDNATTGGGTFLINNIGYGLYGADPLILWGNNTNPYVYIIVSNINMNIHEFLENTSGNTTSFLIKIIGGINHGDIPTLTSNPLASGQLLEITGILHAQGTTSTAGTTAGTVINKVIDYSPQYSKLILYFNGYENDTTTNQTIDFPITFSSYAGTSLNTTGLTISATTSGIKITAPDSTTTYSGIVIVEGY